MNRACLMTVLSFFLLCTSLVAQTEDEAARERQRKLVHLTDKLIAEAGELRLAENKAVIYAAVGQRLWDTDRKRAQGLFEESIAALLTAQAELELDRKKGLRYAAPDQSVRPNLLRTIAVKNASFALSSLYRTRPAAVQRAFGSAGKDSMIRGNGNEQYLVQNELNLEHYLVKLAAEQDPSKAVELLKASLKKGFTVETLNLLKKLHESDPSAAADLSNQIVAEVIRKISSRQGNIDYNLLQPGLGFLNEHLRERPETDLSFRFASADMKSLLDRLLSFVLEEGPRMQGRYYFYPLIQIAEKMRPDAVEKLRSLHRGSLSSGFSIHDDPRFGKLIHPETPIEQVLTEVPKLPLESRRQVYSNVANRLAAAGELTRARQIIADNFSDEALESAQAELTRQHVHHTINAGRFAEAEALIEQLEESARFPASISLAETIFYLNRTENKAQAVAVLERLRASVPTSPGTSTELSQLMQLIAAYSRIEPTAAFPIFESLIPSVNELTEASVKISAYNGSQNTRGGEIVIGSGWAGGIINDGSIVRGMAQFDMDRAIEAVKGFSRRELRVFLYQQLLEGL